MAWYLVKAQGQLSSSSFGFEARENVGRYVQEI